jgi:hypothetical protein
MVRSAALLAAVATLLAGTACSNEPTAMASPSGALTLRLSTPNQDDGALLFQVSGPPIDTVIATGPSLRLFTRRVNDSTVVGAMVGTVTGGAVVRLLVPDAGAAGRYSTQVLEVADRQDALRASLAGYALTVDPR